MGAGAAQCTWEEADAATRLTVAPQRVFVAANTQRNRVIMSPACRGVAGVATTAGLHARTHTRGREPPAPAPAMRPDRRGQVLLVASTAGSHAHVDTATRTLLTLRWLIRRNNDTAHAACGAGALIRASAIAARIESRRIG